MKIKEIYVEAKKSYKFQTYTFGELIELNENEQSLVKEIRKAAINRCRNAAIEQLEIDNKQMKGESQ